MGRRAARSNRIVIATVLIVAASLLACTRNPYVLGAICPDGGAATDPRCSTSPGVTFAIGLDESGVSRLGASLELPSGAVPATLRLRGESAVAQAWPSEQGSRLLLLRDLPTPSTTQLPTPFTDGTRAVAPAPGQATYVADSLALGEVGTDDFVLELVLRTTASTSVIAKRDQAAGWSLATETGTLTLGLSAGQRFAAVVSEPLVPGAWMHCLLWVSHAEGGRIDCNGRAGTLTDLGALGDLTNAGSLTVGGVSGDPDPVQLALFTLFRVAPGRLGAFADWLAIGRRRFADLTGSRPRLAGGSALPKPGLRDSPAYVDIDLDPTQPRRLFLVGPDWPRIACRVDAAGARDCGYLSEPRRQRRVPATAGGWALNEITLNRGQAVFAGDGSMYSLVPTPTAGSHGLSITGAFAGARQAFSFFARAGQGKRVGASAGALGMAIFDVAAGSVVSAPPGVDAAIEGWGGGLFRCVYTFAPAAGPLTYGVHLLDDTGSAAFAGDGTSAWAYVAGLQLDVGQANVGTLLGADDQAADELTFVGDDGNLPPGATGSVSLRVLLPPGLRLTDQAIINLNRGGTFADQIQLFVRGDTGQLQFWGLRGGATDWTLESAGALTDGLRHRLGAGWAVTTASLRVDTVQIVEPALIPDATPFAFDRIDVGFSNSSGHLEGLIGGLQIGR